MEELVERAKNKDKTAFSELIVKVKKELYLIAKTKLNNEEDIADAIQETLLISYKNLKKLRKNEIFKTWIIRILINECNKTYKRKSKHIISAGKKEYIKTYNVIEKINIDDETGDNDYYVLKQFQDDNLVIVKIKNTYNLEINQNYEFVLYGEKEERKTYSQNDIFETFEIKDIRKTDKVGLEQIQDF